MSKVFTFRNVFIVLGLLVQFICWLVTGDPTLSFISGSLGVVAVVLCSDRKFSFYTFGFLQLGTYLVLAWQENLWGEVGENIFYFLTMLLGLVIWKKYLDEDKRVSPKKLKIKEWGTIMVGTVLGILVLWIYLSKTNDPQPLLDSITTVPAIVAQVLMILRYREQWIFWGIIDLGSIVLWYNAGDYCMVAQYIFWTINCIYGWTQWKTRNSYK